MSARSVMLSLERWVQKGLLTPETAKTLVAELEEELRSEGQRWTQYALAATGGAILIIAGGTFLAWAWPEMGYAAQSVSLGVIGLVVSILGFRLLPRPRFVPVAYLLLISGPVLFFMAMAYSENAWEDATFGAIVTGVLALAMPSVALAVCLKKDAVLGALQAGLSPLFLFLFLDRTFGLSLETNLWILDGVAVAALAWLAYRLRDPEGPAWVLNTFFAILYASILLVFFSGDLLWDLEEFVMIPADIWLLIVGGLSLWALQDDLPVHLQRDWYERQLAYCILIAIPFSFITTLETMNAGPTTAALTVAAVGAFGLWVSIPRGVRSILLASCVALLIAAWYYGAEKAGALGAVLALSIMAVVLFWGASKLGAGKAEEGIEA